MNRSAVRAFSLANSLAPLAAALALSACGGYAGSDTNPDALLAQAGGTTGGAVGNCTDLFTKRVQPRLEFCRNCHVPGGIADVADGKKFQLSSNPAEDYDTLRASWLALGGNDDGPSRILKMSSGTDTRSHSGGTPWPVGSGAYQDMDALLKGFVDPAACSGGSSGDIAEAWPLLGGPRGGGVLSKFCEGKDDDTPVPADPRTLIKAGVNQGKAVAFNAYWTDCFEKTKDTVHDLVPRPKTCGELRAQAKLGEFVGEGQGEIGTPVTFAGGQDVPSGLSSDNYNTLWQSAWGLSARPENFDELVAQRYGSPHSVGRNPYPLPGENPNDPVLDGGSGQLPLAFTQIRNPDGTWTGQIGTKVCVMCHNGEIGTPADGPGMGVQFGGAGSIGDFAVAGYDFAKAAGLQGGSDDATSAITISTNRGTGAIDFFQLAFVLFSGGDPNLLLNDKIVNSQAIGNIKSPPWWNLAYRAQKFHGAVLPTDSSRIDLAAYYDLGASFSSKEPLAWMDAHAGPFQIWAETLSPPPFPGAIDRALAEKGAILFHSKNLWANTTDPAKPDYQAVPKPDAGNGSCAGCHGVYSPRYAHDSAYLDTPDLAGFAAYTVPMSVIGTDPVYADAMQSLRNSDGSVPDAVSGQDVVYCGLGNASYTPNLTPILLAPPLWGTWAAAPYFHNGSVPNIWGVLDPAGDQRPRMFKRVSTPVPDGQPEAAKIVMGYDTDFARAYDTEHLGWKYDALVCGNDGTQPLFACNPVDESQPSPVQALLAVLYTEAGLTWNLPRPEGMTMTQQDIENRKVFNTNLYSQGNGGHAFTSVLTDAERRAIIEYLKTL